MLITTIAWDNALSWSWENAITALQETLFKVSVNRLCFFRLSRKRLVETIEIQILFTMSYFLLS